MSALIAATAFAGTVAAGQDLRKARVAEWKPIVAKFQKPSALRAAWQLSNSVALYVLLWFLMYWSLKISHLLTLSLTILSGAVVVRVFIIMHDCGHGSFLKSKLANDIVGFVAGIVVFTPYYHWRWEHSLHHASSGDLDRRGTGDVWTMTVQEYLDSSRWMRCVYRLARNPFVLLVIAPVFVFVFRQRFSSRKANSRERWSVWWTNLGILGMALTLSWVFGWKMYLFIQLLSRRWPGQLVSGCSTFSISSTGRTGSAVKHGITQLPPSKAVLSTVCPRFSSGSRAVLGFTTSITSAPASPIIIWSDVTEHIRFSNMRSLSRSGAA